MEGEPLGIVLYGYDGEDAKFIKEGIEELMEKDVILISASGNGNSVIGELLERQPEGPWKQDEMKFLMFLGFDEEGFSTVMDRFPKKEGLKRPIFCTLTQNNVRWTVKQLIEDLKEEEAYWKKMRASG